jgi:hypothetical protein
MSSLFIRIGRHLVACAALLLAASGPVELRAQDATSTPIDAAADTGPDHVNNAALIPKLLPDEQVQMEGMSPDWMKTLIMAEVRIETATPQGTFDAATALLDHYAAVGVNGLWVTPIWVRPANNGYGNFGIGLVDPHLSGTDNPDDSVQAVKRFVDQAHQRNIRVLFDVIVWGTAKDAPLVTQHPEFYAMKNGQHAEAWGGYAFNWKSEELKKWYCDQAVNFIDQTGADGFRVDLAPDCSGFFFKQVRDALYAQGHKIAIMAEIPCERKDTFDFEENGVQGWPESPDYAHKAHLLEQKKEYGNHNEFLLRSNIVDDITSGRGIGTPALIKKGQGGMFRFYTSNLLNHDDSKTFVNGNRVRFGYTGIFAPFIPLWFMGEEFDNPLNYGAYGKGVLYFNTIDWDRCTHGDSAAFYEDCKKYVAIRRTYPDIFQAFPDSTRQANIVKVDSVRAGTPNPLQAYARFAGGKAILVVPNYQGDANSTGFDITPPFAALGLPVAGPCTITDLMTGQAVFHGDAKDAATIHTTIQPDYLGVYLVEQK